MNGRTNVPEIQGKRQIATAAIMCENILRCGRLLKQFAERGQFAVCMSL